MLTLSSVITSLFLERMDFIQFVVGIITLGADIGKPANMSTFLYNQQFAQCDYASPGHALIR